MTDHVPSNAVLLEKIENILKKNEEILAQTTKTNGRVSKLETWQNRIIGAMVLMNIIGVPVLVALFIKFLKI